MDDQEQMEVRQCGYLTTFGKLPIFKTRPGIDEILRWKERKPGSDKAEVFMRLGLNTVHAAKITPLRETGADFGLFPKT
jgi:hypothetical protein